MPRRNRSHPNSDDQHEVAGRRVASHVRDRQRAVAEREASRLARPERRRTKVLNHADRKKSAVSSTPFGFHKSRQFVEESEEEWCGPWSVARQIIAEREETRRKQEEEKAEHKASHPLDDLLDEHKSLENKRKHPCLSWKGDISSSCPTSIYAKRQRRADVQRGERRVPSLFQLCVDFVVSNFEYVESLGDIGNDIRVAISRDLVAQNKLNGKALEALVEPSMETLEIVDCSGIPQHTLANIIGNLSSLRYLLLHHAGRVFGPTTVGRLIESKPALCCLSLSGAYLLKDVDAASLIKACPTLQSIALDTCPLVGDLFVDALCSLRNILELDFREMVFSEDALKKLASCAEVMRSCKSITLKSMRGLSDCALSEILMAAGDALESLNVDYNNNLSDACLSGIRRHNCCLRSLSLNGVRGLSATGLLTFFLQPVDGLPPPPKLKMINLGSCDHEAVTDEVLELATASASGHQRNAPISHELTGGGLSVVDVQGSTLVTDCFLERLVETSASTLTDLNISYCPKLTDKGLGYLLDKTGKQLKRIHVWGCAQLTDEFFDGHSRVGDQTLEILGAWMKKSGMRSLR